MGVTLTLDNKSPDAAGNLKGERYTVAITNTPTIAGGTGAGTSPTIAIAGTDIAGTISVTTGTSCAGSAATLVTVSFANTMAVAPDVILTPANAAASALSGVTAVVAPDASTSTTQFLIKVGSTALADSTAYVWNFVVRNARTTATLTTNWIRNIVDVHSTIPLLSVGALNVSSNSVALGVVPESASGRITVYGS